MKFVLCVLLTWLGACAWSNPANRPVWSAFENHLVPEHDAAFYATLPLTVPAGFVAIAADSLLVHPVRVTDDAAGDAGDLWQELDWQKQYYTELGFLPLRVVATPCVFVFSWLGRSCFDIDPRESRDPEVRAAQLAAVALESKSAWLAFFAGLLEGRVDCEMPDEPPVEWDEDLGAAFDHAYGTLGARGRWELLRAAAHFELAPLSANPWLGFRDPDPVVRYLMLGSWRGMELPTELREKLMSDENEMVRTLALKLLGDG